ncbi:hypothetical protein PSI19_00115 [Xenorhabdus khoisanae]|uniref:hypothetical protein n=1 Tax=Xenorhabdus khoisanae TaxID=880157 RepID=UPI002358331F|nr:hypothetical protein [Xenorhabdus khoisanae]MDC9612316.1 hypothetical protein [Xenorhabdus khoisanae]
MSQGTATSTFTVGIKYDTETLSWLEAQLERIAELLDRIDGRREAGMKLSTDSNAKAGVTADGFKVCDSERKVRAVVAPLELAVDINANAIINEIEKAYRGTAKQARLSSAVINSAKIPSIPDDDHIRQIIREEIRQFVARESERGGLFSTW